MQLTNFVLDLIFPKKCIVCGRFDFWLCLSCQNAIKLSTRQICPICLKPSINGVTHPSCKNTQTLDGFLYASHFQQLQDIIHSYKYSLIDEISKPLSEIIIKFIEVNDLKNFITEFTAVPVPLHKTRLRFRGFNQSELLAQLIAKKYELSRDDKILIRKKFTIPQITLDKSHRKTNLTGAFACQNSERIKNKKILLIDDVSTTCATLNECAKVLKRNGAKMVWGLVVAHG